MTTSLAHVTRIICPSKFCPGSFLRLNHDRALYAHFICTPQLTFAFALRKKKNFCFANTKQVSPAQAQTIPQQAQKAKRRSNLFAFFFAKIRY
jgi:hypothetical protein